MSESIGGGGSAAVVSLTDASSVLSFWREFDLDGRRLLLDKSCLEMRESKTASMNGRKRLNEVTKIFRSKSSEEQLGMITELLKAYQEEIDQLSRRSKFSETCFYGLYKAIFEAPDPSIALESLLNTVSSTSTHQLEIERLRGELEQYDEEFSALKNQEITIRHLEDQLDEYRDQIEDKVVEEVAKRTAEAEEVAQGKVAEAKEMQRVAERRLAAAVESMKQAQASADRAQTQLFEVSSQAELRVSALFAENAILAEGSERARARAAEAESEIEALKALVSSHSGGSSSSSSSGSSSNSLGSSSSSISSSSSSNNNDTAEELRAMQTVVSDLRQEARRKEDTYRSERHRLESANRESQLQLSKEREHLGRVRQELTERPTKEELQAARRQLRVLQKVVFNVEDDETDGISGDPENTLGDKVQLEVLLTTRMKALETELGEARRHLSEANKQEVAAKENVATLKASLEASSALVTRLEADLETQIQKVRGGGGARAAKGGVLGSSGGIGGGLGGGSGMGGTGAGGGGSMDLSELLGVEATDSYANKGGGSDANSQMASILQAQRDRYKQRLGVAESSLLSLQQQLVTVSAARTQAEQDNLALYSKIRYLSSVRSDTGGATHLSPQAMRIRQGGGARLGGSSSSNSSTSRGDEESGESRGGDDDIEGRYKHLYEQRLNPFAEFSKNERQKRLDELSVSDRVVFNTLSAFISTQAGRSFLLIYLGVMHLLVFFVLYYMTHHIHFGCDPSLDHTNHHPEVIAEST